METQNRWWYRIWLLFLIIVALAFYLDATRAIGVITDRCTLPFQVEGATDLTTLAQLAKTEYDYNGRSDQWVSYMDGMLIAMNGGHQFAGFMDFGDTWGRLSLTFNGQWAVMLHDWETTNVTKTPELRCFMLFPYVYSPQLRKYFISTDLKTFMWYASDKLAVSH